MLPPTTATITTTALPYSPFGHSCMTRWWPSPTSPPSAAASAAPWCKSHLQWEPASTLNAISNSGSHQRKFFTHSDQWYITFSWFSIRISITMFWNLISMMAATVSSWGRSRVGPNTTPRFATVIKFCLWLLATLGGRKRKDINKRKTIQIDSWLPRAFPIFRLLIW